MSFVSFGPQPLHTVEQFMATFIMVADELDMPDKRGAAICAAMCCYQEAGGDPHKTGTRHIWTPGNHADPCFAADPNLYPHDSVSNDSASTGPYQQQAGKTWGWGGNLGDPAGTAKRMDMTDSTRLFMGHPQSGLKKKGYDASSAQAANDSIQKVQGSSFPNAYTKWWEEANALYNRVADVTPPPIAPTGEHVIAYDRGIVPQDTQFWCGPAAAQTVLNGCGIVVDENRLANDCRTTANGTDYVGLIEKGALDPRLPGANYTSVYLPSDPLTQQQKDKLWDDLVRSIDAGFGVIMNWVAPPGNKPRGVKGSPNPSYGGGTTFHYVAAMGYDDAGARAVWIADSGFRPFGYWVSFDQCATLIPPKGYCYADFAPVPTAPPLPPIPPPPVVVPEPAGTLNNPVNRSIISSSSYRPRGLPTPRWIGLHTQEGGRTAEGLAMFLKNPANQVSYHTVNDEKEIIRCVEDDDAPWAAANANKYALHHCFAGSYAGWSRDKWLETDPADGKNEDLQLTRGAEMVAWWCQEYKIPAVWIGGKAQPPWGLDGICGHQDFGGWGGGHHDPGPNFPVDEFMRRVTGFLTGVNQPPLVPLPPSPVPGTDPTKYAGVLIYRGRPQNDPAQVKLIQTRLKKAYASYAGHLAVDGDYSWSDEMVVREFQRRSRLVVDGIVGPNTAAALKPW